MSTPRTICTGIGIVCITAVIAYAAPQTNKQTNRTTMRIGSANHGASTRGVGFTMCDSEDILVSENVDMATITQGNSVNCYGSSGTPEHRYGRSHDLSQGDTAGLPWEITCIHFGLSQNSVAGIATVNVYIDQDGVAGPTPNGSDLWLIGTVEKPIPETTTPVTITASPVTPYPLNPNALIFIEIVIPASFPGTHEIGSNDAGEFSISWLRTTNDECGIGQWQNPANLGFPNMHIVEAIEIAPATIADPCDDPLPSCASDIDGSGTVTVDDLLAVIGSWGQCGDGTSRPSGDVAPLPNGDCCIDVNDILQLISDFGLECGGGGVIELGINELRIDHTGTDDNEYIELIGPAGTALDGYSYIVIGDGTGGSGVLETVVDLTGLVIADDGLLSLGKPEMTIAIPDVYIDDLNLENSDNVTHLLVQGLTAMVGDDLDVEDDGILDGLFWDLVADSFALIDDPTGGELVYADVTLGPAGLYVPAHVFRCPDGGEWLIGVWGDLAMDTPGNPNMCDLPDSDGDGIFDLVDNCYLYNPEQNDCDGNEVGDVCDIANGTFIDCNSNGIPDQCEIDCNSNGISDECDIADGTSIDCNSNGVPDECDPDCNVNTIPDDCDIANGTSQDSNGNGVPDECEGAAFVINEINADPDSTLGDANGDGEAHYSNDEFVEIVNMSGSDIDMSNWTLSDGYGVRHTFSAGTIVTDGCAVVIFGGGTPVGNFGGALVMVASTGSLGLNNAGDTVTIVDTSGSIQLQVDYTSAGNNQSITRSPDVFGDLFFEHSTVAPNGALFSPGTDVYVDGFGDCGGALPDSDGDGIPDDFDNCDLPNPNQADCNENTIGDVCDIADGTSTDDNGNGIPDECEGTAIGAWINEFHYDNASSDINELVEVVLWDTIDANSVTLSLYNGNGGTVYASYNVGADMTMGEIGTGYVIYSVLHAGIQNGSPDGIAIDISGTISHFISYEGSMTATGGPAAGMTSEDVLIAEHGGSTENSSIGLSGSGSEPMHFAWIELVDLATIGVSNEGQVIVFP